MEFGLSEGSSELAKGMEDNLAQLRIQMETVMPYPEGVIPVPETIPGLAFFPGGTGLWQDGIGANHNDIPVGGVMVLGHNFDSHAGYKRSLLKKEENRNGATWRPLIKLLVDAGVELDRCFFTNFFMGLIEEGSSIGVFPGAKDPKFVARCRWLLLQQIRIQKPAYILTLGIHVPPLIASVADELAPWTSVRSLMEMDERGSGLVRSAAFLEAAHTCPVVALTHPCLRHLNIGRRRFDGIKGDEAEISMIHKAAALGA